jgi:hypothetical protein
VVFHPPSSGKDAIVDFLVHRNIGQFPETCRAALGNFDARIPVTRA